MYKRQEKLYEEVLNEEETSKPTFHPKIKIAQVRAYDYADANLRIDALDVYKRQSLESGR